MSGFALLPIIAASTVLVLSFAILLLIAGIFTLYFGSGKSKVAGAGMSLVGVIVGIGMGYYFHIASHELLSLILLSLQIVVAIVIGLLIAFGIFLAIIMKL
jgi:hypothetical protein